MYPQQLAQPEEPGRVHFLPQISQQLLRRQSWSSFICFTTTPRFSNSTCLSSLDMAIPSKRWTQVTWRYRMLTSHFKWCLADLLLKQWGAGEKRSICPALQEDEISWTWYCSAGTFWTLYLHQRVAAFWIPTKSLSGTRLPHSSNFWKGLSTGLMCGVCKTWTLAYWPLKRIQHYTLPRTPWLKCQGTALRRLALAMHFGASSRHTDWRTDLKNTGSMLAPSTMRSASFLQRVFESETKIRLQISLHLSGMQLEKLPDPVLISESFKRNILSLSTKATSFPRSETSLSLRTQRDSAHMQLWSGSRASIAKST